MGWRGRRRQRATSRMAPSHSSTSPVRCSEGAPGCGAACGSELRRCALAAGAFLDLAADESRAWNRKACFLNYAPAAAAQQRP